MVNPDKFSEDLENLWALCETAPDKTAAATWEAVQVLVEIFRELQAHRPLELGGIPQVIEGDGTASTVQPRATETAHGNRLDLVKHVAIEELNVAPQVAEYARRILMGARPEPDRGVMDTLWGYAAMEVPEGYTLTDAAEQRARALYELVERATNDGVHPAAAELARRILAGEGPTVEIHHHITGLIQELPLVRLDGSPPTSQAVALDPPRTVLAVSSSVDLEPGDLGEEGQ